MANKIRNRRGAIERQTNERYKTVRRKCRVLRGCNAQSRNDEDFDTLSLGSRDEFTSELLPVAQPDELNFVVGKTL